MYGPRMTTRYSFCWDSARLESRRFRTNNRVMSDKQPLSGVPGKRDSWEFHVHLAAKRPMHRSAGRCSPEVRIWEAWRSSADHSRETPVTEIGRVNSQRPAAPARAAPPHLPERDFAGAHPHGAVHGRGRAILNTTASGRIFGSSGTTNCERSASSL